MNKILAMPAVFILLSCSHGNKPDIKKTIHKSTLKEVSVADTIEKPMIQYTDRQLESFLDSVGHLSVHPLLDKVAFGVDSVFRNQLQMDTTLSLDDFNKLKHAARKGVIAVNLARRIFGNNKIDSACNEKSVLSTYKPGLIPVVYYPFNKNKKAFDEFALCIGDPAHCQNACLYFLRGQKVIARHNGYDRNGLDMGHHVDIDGKTVINYKVEVDRGSGIWWYQFFFYKYDGNKLIPVLSVPQNINLLQPSPWGVRELWFESFVQKTDPLVIKMVYHQQLPDTIKFDYFTTDPNLGPMIVNDSTYVRYSWNEQTKTLEGNFRQSKINQPQILSYYLTDNELLFINAYYKDLKFFLLNKSKRKSILHYLNEIKNQSNRNNRGR